MSALQMTWADLLRALAECPKFSRIDRWECRGRNWHPIRASYWLVDSPWGLYYLRARPLKDLRAASGAMREARAFLQEADCGAWLVWRWALPQREGHLRLHLFAALPSDAPRGYRG